MTCVICDNYIIDECDVCSLCERPVCFEGVCYEQMVDDDGNIFCTECFNHLKKYMSNYDFDKKFNLDSLSTTE